MTIHTTEKLNKTVRVIGLTGGIASGKTVATDALREAGFYVVDADEVSRALFGRGTDGEKQIAALFPEAARGGALDRATLRVIISGSEKKRDKLNALTHPAILTEIEREIVGAKSPGVLSAPLLFESGLYRLCDATVCITAPREVKLKRLTARDGMTEPAAAAMIDMQISDDERTARADFVLSSDRPREEFTAEVVKLFTSVFSGV